MANLKLFKIIKKKFAKPVFSCILQSDSISNYKPISNII
jgi:hypothetical protein